MSFDKFLAKVKDKSGMTIAEWFVSLIIILGLGIAFAHKQYNSDSFQINESAFSALQLSSERQNDNKQESNYLAEIVQTNASATWQSSDLAFAPNQEKKKKSGKLSAGDNVKININTAPISELQKLPGIGEKTAEAIMEFRRKKPFLKIEDIMLIKGIGIKKFEKMKDFIVV